MRLPHEVGSVQDSERLAWALAWAQAGWPVFPVQPGGKEPLIPAKRHRHEGQPCKGACGKQGHGAYDGTTDPETIRQWWRRWPDANIGGNTEGRLVIDLDTQHFDDASWAVVRELPATGAHLSGRGNGNMHLVYRLDADATCANPKSGNNVLARGIDIKTGRGSYVVLPPSLHPDTGMPYTVSGPDEATEGTVLGLEDLAGLGIPVRGQEATKSHLRVVGGGSGTTLSELLANPPAEGNRNQWLTTVAGHYASQYRHASDLYWVHLQQANRLLAQPLDDEEFTKTGNSIWETETLGKSETGAGPSADNGYLVGNGQTLAVQCRVAGETILEPFADFDITARGMAVAADDTRTWWVTLHTPYGPLETTIDSAVLGDKRATDRLLAGYGCSISEPANASPKVSVPTRVLRYIRAQEPPQVVITDTLGWDSRWGGYVTSQGVVGPDGLKSKDECGVCASPTLETEAGYLYGFAGTKDEAIDTLREVLTFQDPTVTSVFGSWWCAVLAKEQIRQHTSLFPFVGVEASSGSGKTNGFFNLMSQLIGSTRGESTMTRAVTRTIASLNHSGFAWIDDMDKIETVTEVLRAATSGGSMSKMGEDNHTAKSIQIVSGVLVTGEHLGFTEEKALADRAINLAVPSPVGRQSLIDPDRPQWDDIVALQSRWPEEQGGLARMSGWFLQIMAGLITSGRLDELIAQAKQQQVLRRGRLGDKDLVLLTGALVLAEITGDDQHLPRVIEWIADQAANSGIVDEAENSLTTKILPRLLRELDYPQYVTVGEPRDPYSHTPVIIKRNDTAVAKKWLETQEGIPEFDEADAPTILFNTPMVAAMWEQVTHGRIIERTESLASLLLQTTALGCARVSVRVVGGSGSPMKYRRLPSHVAREVYQRSLGQ